MLFWSKNNLFLVIYLEKDAVSAEDALNVIMPRYQEHFVVYPIENYEDLKLFK